MTRPEDLIYTVDELNALSLGMVALVVSTMHAGLCRGDAECGTRGREGRQAHVDAGARQGDEKPQQQGGGHGGRRNPDASGDPMVGRSASPELAEICD